jgi:hypothetical protein
MIEGQKDRMKKKKETEKNKYFGYKNIVAIQYQNVAMANILAYAGNNVNNRGEKIP